jgi:ATP-binding cassette, subfamily B, bacterial
MRPFRRASDTEPTPHVKPRPLLSALRTMGVQNLFWVGLAFTLLSLISGLCQAALLLSIAQIAVASVQGKKYFHILGHGITPSHGVALSFVLIALSFATSFVSAMIGCTLTTRALSAGRIRVIDSFFGASWAQQASERLGRIQNLLTMNSGATAGAISSLSGIVQSLVMVVALLSVALAVDPLAAIAVIGVGVFLSLVMRPLSIKTRAAARALSTHTRAMGTQVTEFTRLVRDFRIAGVEPRAIGKMHDSVDNAAKYYFKVQRYGLITPIVYSTVALCFVLGALALLIRQGHSNIASLGAVLLLILRAVSSGTGLQASFQGLRSSQGMLEDLLVDIEELDASRLETVGQLPRSFELVFNSVSYSYDGITQALNDVSFYIPEGSIVGVLGPSGSGKTTITQIILGLRQPDSGTASIGDVDAREVEKGDGKSPIALVPQEPVLLQTSILENVRFFRDLSDEDVLAASRLAHLDQDVAQMPAGYETQVGPGGTALSGGQKQRLAIARALINSPKLIVLDEPTSALDGRNEKLVRQTLSELRGHVTVIIISHRLDTTAECDYLLILDKGRVAEFGSRDHVVHTPAFYKIVNLTEGGISARDGGPLPWLSNSSAMLDSYARTEEPSSETVL